MRTFGRIPVYVPGTNRQAIDPVTRIPVTQWVEVDTSSDGFNDDVYLTTLCQVLKLNLGESPFYGNYGIPSKVSVVQQVSPDFYVMNVQQQFAGYFANLSIARTSAPLDMPLNTPTYNVAVTTHLGSKRNTTVSIAT